MSKLTELGFNPQITKNFSLNELTCSDGTAVPWNRLDNAIELLQNLQVLRDAVGVPIEITSGFRNATYNKSIGGAPASEHIQAEAADIKIKGLTPKQVAAKIEELIKAKKMKQGGLGIYKTWVHYDVRGTSARWNG